MLSTIAAPSSTIGNARSPSGVAIGSAMPNATRATVSSTSADSAIMIIRATISAARNTPRETGKHTYSLNVLRSRSDAIAVVVELRPIAMNAITRMPVAKNAP